MVEFLIIRKSIKLALMPLGAGVLLLLAFNWLSEYLDFSSNQYLRDVSFGIYLLLILSFLKFIYDFYLIYIKRAHVEVTDKGILDKTMPVNESFYAWCEIKNVKVKNGLFCEGLKVIYRKM